MWCGSWLDSEQNKQVLSLSCQIHRRKFLSVIGFILGINYLYSLAYEVKPLGHSLIA
jgi:hypothetical protein